MCDEKNHKYDAKVMAYLLHSPMSSIFLPLFNIPKLKFSQFKCTRFLYNKSQVIIKLIYIFNDSFLYSLFEFYYIL